MTITNTEAVSEQFEIRIGVTIEAANIDDAMFEAEHISAPGLTVMTVDHVLSRRATNSAGGVEVKALDLLAKQPIHGLPKAYGGCTCSCHRMPGVMHIAACCRPSDDEREPLMTREWFERKVVLEGDGDVSAGPLSSPAVEAEPVAWINGEREIMLGWFRRYIDEQYSCGQVDDGMRLERLHKLLSAVPHPSSPVSAEVTEAARDVLAERCRQVEAEGWTPEHDDRHKPPMPTLRGPMALAAAAYAIGPRDWWPEGAVYEIWPWERDELKFTEPRRL